MNTLACKNKKGVIFYVRVNKPYPTNMNEQKSQRLKRYEKNGNF